MTEQEVGFASNALMRWFESQTIEPHEAEVVLAHAIASLITHHASPNREMVDVYHTHWNEMVTAYIGHMLHE